ncbi:MAG: aldo/keto reductase [Bacillota bacterium]
MERRPFGKTGLETSLLGFGGFHLLEIPAREGEVLLDRYLDAGGNYLETAASYGNGESELKVGQVIKRRRGECILTTKTLERSRQGCLDSLDRSLHNLQTDHVDLLIMHAVGTMADLDKILGPDGAMEGVHQAQRAGKVRHVGISMHGQPDTLIEALHRYPFDAVMPTVNYFDRCNFPEIEGTLLPLAQKKETAVILMKPVADGFLWRSAEQAFRYAMSQPVSVVVAGINTPDMLQQDLGWAESFRPMTEEEKEQLLRDAPELGNYVCRQCGRCHGCTKGIDIPSVFRLEGYYDRQMRDGLVRDPAEFALRDRLRFWFGGQNAARERYAKLAVKADQCDGCGNCSSCCPYGIDIPRKLAIADYKLAGKKIF